VGVPDYFNGTIRVFAVAVTDAAVGVAEKKVVAQGYFVIQPQAPYFAAPGDEFEVTALVANNLTTTGNGESKVAVELTTSKELQVIGNGSQNVTIARAPTPQSGSACARMRHRAPRQ
jgi:alpha-2-macroglobulin